MWQLEKKNSTGNIKPELRKEDYWTKERLYTIHVYNTEGIGMIRKDNHHEINIQLFFYIIDYITSLNHFYQYAISLPRTGRHQNDHAAPQ